VIRWLIAAALVLAAAAFWLSRPQTLAAADLPDHAPDLANGERVFHAAGCASCHATVSGDGEAGDGLGGGQAFETAYGVFRAPNISPHPEAGIGAWSALDFVNAVQRGVSPGGHHYYPAFPYTAYAHLQLTDVLDLKAWLDTLPAVAQVPAGNELSFPWNLRRGVGFWKLRYLDTTRLDAAVGGDPVARGRYLVEAAGHCGECHTPRDGLGGLRRDAWLAGAPALEGEGRVPNITPHEEGIGAWSEKDIAYYLESGFTPEFDIVGGAMVSVQENFARLDAADREAVAAYLKTVPPHPDTR